MSQELLNTSAPRGLKPGASGFCAVAMTAGMARLLEEQLMSLSGYRWIHPAGHPDAARNPIAFAHWRVMSGGREMSVLSSVRDAGVDYSQRSNRLAHHLVIDPTEQSDAGPAWVLRQPDVVESRWDGELRTWPVGRAIPRGDNPPRPCTAWATAAGDAGWAGVLAEAFLLDPSKPAYLIFAPGTEVLPLIAEAIALLPTALRWRVTFNTYFTDLPAGLICTWRCCAAGTAAANEAPRLATSGVVIDLTKSLGQAPESRLTESARTGRVEVAPFSPSPAMNPRRSMASLPNALAEETFNAPMMEATVAANATPPALRTLTPKPENDDRWMPPTRSTIVETASGGGKAGMPRGGKSRFKVFAILWPMIAMGGILGWHFRGESRGKAELRKQLTVLQSTLETQTAEITQLKGGLENKDATTSQQSINSDNVKADLAKFLSQLSDTQSKLNAKEADLALANQNLISMKKNVERIAPLESKIAGLNMAYAANQAKLEDANDQIAGLKGTAPIKTFFDLSSNETTIFEVAEKALLPDALKLESSDPPKELGIIIKESGRDITISLQTSATTANALNSAIAGPIAIFRLKNRRIAVELNPSLNTVPILKEIRNWLAFQRVIVLSGEKTVGKIGLRSPIVAMIYVSEFKTEPISLPQAQISKWSEAELGMPSELPGSWKADFANENDHAMLRFTDQKSRAVFDLKLNALGTIETTWGGSYNYARNTFRDAEAEVEKRKQYVVNDKTNEHDSTAAKARASTTELKRYDYDNDIRTAVDNKTKHEAEQLKFEDKCESQKAILAALNEIIPDSVTNSVSLQVPVVFIKTKTVILTLKIQRRSDPDQKAK